MMEAHRPNTRHGISAMTDSRGGFDPARIVSAKPVAGSTPGDHRSTASNQAAAENPTPRLIEATIGGRGSLLKDLVSLIGNQGAARLIAAFGGMRVYVPHSPEPDDTLSENIGHETAVMLSQVYGGDRIDIPNPTPRRSRIIELRATGVSIDVIARSLRGTRRRVFQVLAEARRERIKSFDR
jgi:hypothetical protein